ncbi:hypothetical protein RRG08_031510 [Elysia crispata]|uniref:Uncharacterized protein n=1 Tax=Elysia crispata TaxID=231223 RepID=A0AAE0XYW6_9GAST|nr:hypothetical protein RRG08_031510 [Elysia crispata]
MRIAFLRLSAMVLSKSHSQDSSGVIAHWQPSQSLEASWLLEFADYIKRPLLRTIHTCTSEDRDSFHYLFSVMGGGAFKLHCLVRQKLPKQTLLICVAGWAVPTE